MASIGKAQAPLLASNDAQNGELGERERGSDDMAKAPKLNSFGHGQPDGWFSFRRFGKMAEHAPPTDLGRLRQPNVSSHSATVGRYRDAERRDSARCQARYHPGPPPTAPRASRPLPDCDQARGRNSIPWNSDMPARPATGLRITDPNKDPITSHEYPAPSEKSYSFPLGWDQGHSWDALNAQLPVGPTSSDNYRRTSR
jgi:hypothetical protein